MDKRPSTSTEQWKKGPGGMWVFPIILRQVFRSNPRRVVEDFKNQQSVGRMFIRTGRSTEFTKNERWCNNLAKHTKILPYYKKSSSVIHLFNMSMILACLPSTFLGSRAWCHSLRDTLQRSISHLERKVSAWEHADRIRGRQTKHWNNRNQ